MVYLNIHIIKNNNDDSRKEKNEEDDNNNNKDEQEKENVKDKDRWIQCCNNNVEIIEKRGLDTREKWLSHLQHMPIFERNGWMNVLLKFYIKKYDSIYNL